LSVQFAQQARSKNGSRNSARPIATRSASAYTAFTNDRSGRDLTPPVGYARIRFASNAKVNTDTSMPRLRTTGGPASQPSQTGPNQASPARTARSPSLRVGSTDVTTSPPTIRHRPATTTNAPAAPDRAA
jgi:hypothetical protein